MVREIYCKLPTDADYVAQVESNDDAANLLQQIKIVLGTKPGEVLGNPMFGCDLEKYLFLMNFDKEEIIQMVQTEIYQYVKYDTSKFTVTVDVLFGHNAEDAYQYALIDISINKQKCLGIVVNQQ